MSSVVDLVSSPEPDMEESMDENVEDVTEATLPEDQSSDTDNDDDDDEDQINDNKDDLLLEDKPDGDFVIAVGPTRRKYVPLDGVLSVDQLKNRISETFSGLDAAQIGIVFNGLLLKDTQLLSHLNIVSGTTIHFIVKEAPHPQPRPLDAASASTASDVRQTPFGLGGIGGLPGLSAIGMGSANYIEMQQLVQTEMMKNPAFFKQVMDSPLTANLMAHPEIIKSLIYSNPQMRQLLEKFPDLDEALSSPEILRQTMEISKNTDLMHELMTNQVREQNNPVTTAAAAAATTSTSSSSSPPLTGASLYTSAGMQSLMQQMVSNADTLQNMLNAPYMKSIMSNLAADPDMAANIFCNNPLFMGNPALQEQMKRLAPVFVQQMQNPVYQSVLSNQDALKAIHQVQDGLSKLQASCPDLYSSLGMPTIGMGMDLTSSLSVPGNGGPTTDGVTAFHDLMNAMVANMSQEGLNLSPEQRYPIQLSTLKAMGFMDHEANVKALISTSGDMNAAINQLVRSMQP